MVCCFHRSEITLHSLSLIIINNLIITLIIIYHAHRFMHWAPFFLMGRMLFLHHYLPSFIFSAMATTTLLDFIFRDFARPLFRVPPHTPMRNWRGRVPLVYLGFAVVFMCVVLYGFYYFSPLCYGLGFPDKATLQTRKWLPSWDLQYA